jgi:hypothetical protein
MSAEAVPEVDAAFCVTQGKNARPLPAEGAIRAAQPCFEIEGLSGLNGGSPSGQHFVAIIRMEVASRSLRLDLFESLAEVFQHLLVGECDFAAGREQRDDLGQASTICS